MQFASKTREQAGFTPEPYRFYFSGKSMPASHIEGWDKWHTHVYFDPDNQWHGVGTNPPNPILVAFRLTGGSVYYADLPQWPTADEIMHARKVLTRLKIIRDSWPEEEKS